MAAANLAVPVDIFVRAKNLVDKDTLSKSDPYAIIKDEHGRLIGKTEMIKDDLNPDFRTPIRVNYMFERKQTFTVLMFDYDDGKNDDTLGSATFTMGKLMGSRGNSVTLKMEGKGEVTLTGSEIKGNASDTVRFGFQGENLKKMDFFGKSDPYFYIRRKLPNGSVKDLYKSEVIDNTLNPVWKVTPPINIAELCGGDGDSECIIFSCFDKDTFSDDSMGDCLLSLNELLRHNHEKIAFEIKDRKESYGRIRVAQCQIIHQPTFVEYLNAGMELNINMSIDMTGSNLEPKNPKSLHHYDPNVPNQYIRAMLAISNVVQEYDTDKQFPCFGFGAMLPGQQGANHFFNLDLAAPTPYIGGMQAVIDTYVRTVNSVRLYGPTNFAPTIQNVTAAARQQLDQGVYSILLILTDGVITDMDRTIDAIVAADDAPISIIIVGVGQAEFDSMEELDGDGQQLRASNGRVSRRDLVQFVAFRDYERRGPEELAAELLQEIPAQVTRWGAITGIGTEYFSKKFQ